MKQRAIRACLAVALVVAIAYGIHQRTMTVQAAAAMPAGANAVFLDDTNGNLTHTSAACAAASNPGRNTGSWVEVPCTDLPTGCLSTSSGAANVAYNVDDMIDNGTDPSGICLRGGHSDTITWSSAQTARKLTISHFNAAGGNNNAHPFSSNPPFGNASSNSVTSPAVSNVGTPGKCYKFNTFIQVNGPGGVQCWDPHIYTSCDTSCTSPGPLPRPKAAAKKKK